jgi:hypothetical protein
VPDLNNTFNLPIPGSPRFESDVAKAISRIRDSLGAGSTPAFGTIELPDLTASRLVALDADNELTNTDLASWIAGTANRITVADDGDGTITLSGPQDIHTGASPTFAGLTIDAGSSPGTLATFKSTGETANSMVLFQAERYLIAYLEAYRTAGAYASFALRRARGTIASPASVADTDEIGMVRFQGHDGTDWENCAAIVAKVDGVVSENDVPTQLDFYTRALGNTNYSLSMRLRADLYPQFPIMAVAGFVKNDANGTLSGGNTLDVGDIPDLSGIYQPLDSGLTAIAGLTPTDSNFIVGNGSAWIAESGDTARTSLGLGTGNTPTFESLTLTKALNPILKLQSNSSSATESGEIQFWSLNVETGPRIRIVNDESSENLRIDVRSVPADSWTSSLYIFRGTAGQEGMVGIKVAAPQENLHVADTIRADTAFNLNGTDIITASSFKLYGPGTLGDGGTTNYAAFAADGELALHGTARVEKEVNVAIRDFAPGASGPQDEIYGDYHVKEFTIGDDAIVDFELPHDWAAGTDLSVYVIWMIDEAYATGSGEVQWQITWSACPTGATEAIDAPTHSGTLDFGDQNIPATAKYLTRSAVGTISGASLSAEDLIGLTVSRVALDDGSNPTAEPGIAHLQVHYTADKLGIAT